jgi:UDP-N-acetylmuramyl pentapeptide synthase
MNHPGEIAELAALAAPTVALVNNAQREHQEFMASVDAVAAENGSVISALPGNGVAVFPAGDAYSATWAALAGPRRVMRFWLEGTSTDAATLALLPPAVPTVTVTATHAATQARADTPTDSAAELDSHVTAEVRGTAHWQLDHWRLAIETPAGPAELALHIAGRHNARNALAATACALAAGCPLDAVVAGLQGFRPVTGRSQVERLDWPGGAVTLVNDSYNANPDSVRAAIDLLAELPAPRWLLLGDMGEVGEQGPAFHREVGEHARARGIERLWTAGELAAHAAQAYNEAAASSGAHPARHHADTAALVAALRAGAWPAAASVLVKGSRFMKMEQALAVLRQPTPGGPAADAQKGPAHAA